MTERKQIMIYIGVDPGQSGAIAIDFGTKIVITDLYSKKKGKITQNFDLSVLRALSPAITCDKNVIAIIEDVWARPEQGRASIAKFLKHTGQIIGWMQALDIDFIEVTPQKWQKQVFGNMETIYNIKNVDKLDKRGFKIPNPKYKHGSDNPEEKYKYIKVKKQVRDTKAMSMTRARELYPEVSEKYITLKKHDGRADALLLMHYGILDAYGGF